MSKFGKWEYLNCSFFDTITRRVLDVYFAELGFRYKTRSSTGGVIYSRDNIFIEIGYENETYPKYSPRILLGLGKNANDSRWRLSAIPIWFLIPSNRPESKFVFWTFKTEEELVKVLERIRTELLDVYAKPILLDSRTLLENVHAFLNSHGQEQ